jgi:hypothetical protein
LLLLPSRVCSVNSHSQIGLEELREHLNVPPWPAREAAAFCRVSLRTFERFVQRDLPAVPIGARVFFAANDLQRWLDDRRNPVLNRTGAATTGHPASARKAHTMSREEREILALLRRQHP